MRRCICTSPLRALPFRTEPGPLINSAADDFASILTPDKHHIYFHSGRGGGGGDFDLYVARRPGWWDDLGWEAPANLGWVVTGRIGAIGGQDIWHSTRAGAVRARRPGVSASEPPAVTSEPLARRPAWVPPPRAEMDGISGYGGYACEGGCRRSFQADPVVSILTSWAASQESPVPHD